MADGGSGRGDVLHHVKREGELSGRGKGPVDICGGNMSRGKCLDPIVPAVYAGSVGFSDVQLVH